MVRAAAMRLRNIYDESRKPRLQNFHDLQVLISLNSSLGMASCTKLHDDFLSFLSFLNYFCRCQKVSKKYEPP